MSTLGELPLEALHRTPGHLRRVVQGAGAARRPAWALQAACMIAESGCELRRAPRALAGLDRALAGLQEVGD